MTIWAIADIHASPLDENARPTKPMHIFGEQWRDHVDRIESAWNELVADDDTVIVAGDLEWALRPEEAMGTLRRVAGWKARKLLVRGNHDYWWSSKATARLRKVLPPTIDLIHNNSFEVEGFNIAGAKGSDLPEAVGWTEADAKLLNRELERLRLSLETCNPNLPTIAAMHYPPFLRPADGSSYTEVLKEAHVSLCVYGHLHDQSAAVGPRGDHDGICYELVAADYLDFKPLPIAGVGRLLLDKALLR